MTDNATFDPSKIDVSGSITLVIARRSGRNLKGYRIAMHTAVATELRLVCTGTLASLGSRTAVPYADDVALAAGSQYLLVPSDVLVAHRTESQRGRRPAGGPPEPRQVEVDPSARQVLAVASSLPELDADDLKTQSFVFYAAVVGDNPDHRIAFVNKWNPYKAALSGQITTFFGDRLRRVEGPLLVFERSFDMVVTDSAIAVLSPRAFEEVFRDIDSMVARVPVWSNAAVLALPLDDASAARLKAFAGRSGRLAKQLRSLYERGAFEKPLDISKLRDELTRQSLDVDRLLVDNQLVLADDDIPVVLKLIDEKLYTGWLTGTPWDVGTRSKRSA